jgi:hypothetical protein
MKKQFCPECGNPSLQRASISVDSSGQRHYHLSGRYRQKPRVCIFEINDKNFFYIENFLLAIITITAWW